MTGIDRHLKAVLERDMPAGFTPYENLPDLLKQMASESNGRLVAESIGKSEEGRELVGLKAGTGPFSTTLIAGAHADEPVGCETLLHLSAYLASDAGSAAAHHFTFRIVPHINPDGAARNRKWIDDWPNVTSYILKAVRELPGRDIEFGFPSMRPENRAVSDFIAADGPVDLHMSLHGMGFAEGVLLLINREWNDRTGSLRDQYARVVENAGLSAHDHDRKGEKGFEYLGPGFTTTPRGQAMREHFLSIGDESTAALFQDSSMEMMMRLGGDPLCLVTEVPLFVVSGEPPSPPGVPATYRRFKEALPGISRALAGGERFEHASSIPFQIAPIPLEIAIGLQLQALIGGISAKSETSTKA